MRGERDRRGEIIYLAGRINGLGGSLISDDTLLDYLYNHSTDIRRDIRENMPEPWFNVIKNLSSSEKKRFFSALGVVNRNLSKKFGRDATLGDLKDTSPEEMSSWENERLTMQTSMLLILALTDAPNDAPVKL